MTRKCVITIEFKMDGQTPTDAKIIEAFQSVMPAGYVGSEGIDGTNKWGIDIISTDTLLECRNNNETKP